MKKNLLSKLLVAFLLIISFQSFVKAQNSATISKSDYLTDKPANNVYFELLGGGLIYSFNYDTRFSNRHDGVGGRIGAGYNANNGNRFFVLPVAINYLAGKNGKYIEMGGGISYYSESENENVLPFVDNSSHIAANGIIGTLTFGYRIQPEDGGFCFRAGVSPVITKTTFAPYWPYLGLGYTF